MNIEKQLVKILKKKLRKECTGHDYFHALRVYKNAIKISSRYKRVNRSVIVLAALLHDIEDWKFNRKTRKHEEAKKIMQELGVNENIISEVIEIITKISFKGLNQEKNLNSLEAKIVQDADRLDAIGAIGIARCFAYGGYKKRVIYDPSIKPCKYKTLKVYLDGHSTSINHFYEKLLHLKKLMKTKEGKEMAKERHEFMKKYLRQFYREWYCKI